jgi:hypothetical protein
MKSKRTTQQKGNKVLDSRGRSVWTLNPEEECKLWYEWKEEEEEEKDENAS